MPEYRKVAIEMSFSSLTRKYQMASGMHSKNIGHTIHADSEPFHVTGKKSPERPQVKGKFFYVGDEKLWIRGVTYGTFKKDQAGNEYNPVAVEKDFAAMTAAGINVVRIYTPPPTWMLDMALEKGLYIMIGMPWEQHVTFLDRAKTVRNIKTRIREMAREVSGHSATLCYVIGNEIPAPIVRWHGRKKIESFLESLYRIIKKEDPEGLVTYVNFPTTEYLQLPFLDFHCFNVYLEEQEKLESYLARLQNIAGDLPLVMGEIGLDSRRNGEEKQAQVIDWQIRTAFRIGCAGAFVFAWTDEWNRGGYDIEDWDFGLTDRCRMPKKAMISVQRAFAEVPIPADRDWPRISVVVCSYNGSKTIRECFEGLLKLEYPDFEVIVVNDGSTDRTEAIAREFDFRLISTENRGLSSARNTGLEEATGEIVAYIDDDAYPDPDWLKYLAAMFMASDCVGVGGPNLAPPNDGRIADCIAHSPGGPVHVLVSDVEAEHIPGCNMAFRRKYLRQIGGFDPQFRVAGDDVDICWRIQHLGGWVAFAHAAVVWHHRRNSIRTYLKQQIGYSKAETLLEQKWPHKYNRIGHMKWSGRIYGNGHTKIFGLQRFRIYYGTFGGAPFQSLYGDRPNMLQSLFLMPEWYIVNITLLLLTMLGLLWSPLLMATPFLAAGTALPFLNITKTMIETSFKNSGASGLEKIRRRLLTGLLHTVQPMARLCGRLRYGMSLWGRQCSIPYAFPWGRKYTLWIERWRSCEYWAELIGRELVKYGGIVRRGSDFDPWDLEISSVLSSLRLQMTVEEHGGGKQLVRFRTWVAIHPMLSVILFAFILLAVLAAMDRMWPVAAMLLFICLILAAHPLRQCCLAAGVCKKVFSDQNELLNHHTQHKRPENDAPH
jgi:O-antigen biosynthesis protein